MDTVEMLSSLESNAISSSTWSFTSDDEDESSRTDEVEVGKTVLLIESEQRRHNHVSNHGGIAGEQVKLGEISAALTLQVADNLEENLDHRFYSRYRFFPGFRAVSNAAGKIPESGLPIEDHILDYRNQFAPDIIDVWNVMGRNPESNLPDLDHLDCTVPFPQEFIDISKTVGKNPEMELREVAPAPQENSLAPKFPWTKGEVIGKGSFGIVYEAVDRNGMWFAVKEVSMVEQDQKAQECIAQLMQEVELLSQFKHDNIVQYLGTQKEHSKLYIFLELASRGSLVAVYKRIRLVDSQISAYTREILKGLKFLHDRSIVHRDIKCANILVNTKGICKLADFGLAKQISSLDEMKSCKGSVYWMAPEVINPKTSYGRPADIWSLGCTILEMSTRSPPFGDQEWHQVLWKVGQGTVPPIPDSLSDAAKDFVKLCLVVNPLERPTATELLEHQFVSQAGA